MKLSESDAKIKDVRLFEWKIDSHTSTDYKPKKIVAAFGGKYLVYKSDNNKKSSTNDTTWKIYENIGNT